MNQDQQPLSIVVPALNEADSLPMLVQRVAEPLVAAGIEYEIILLDDHSTDNTAAVIKTLAGNYNVRHILKVGKRGKAYSLLEAFEQVNYPLVCMIDADLQYPPEAILPMYRKLQAHDADVVVTNRIEQQTSPLRKLSTKVFHFLMARLLFGINYDTQSGLKLFKRSVLAGMDLKPSAWSFDLEFLIRSLEKHCSIVSYAIPFGKREAGEAKVRLLTATYELTAASLKLRMNSSVRQVRRGYLASLELSKRPVGLALSVIAGGLVSAVMLSAVQTPAASALSLGEVWNMVSGNQSSQPAAPSQNQTAPAATGSNQSGSGSATQPAATPAATPAASPNRTATTPAPAANRPAQTAVASNNAATATPDATKTAQVGNTPTAATGDAGTDYYASQSLSPSRTSTLLNTAKVLGISGAAAVLLGGFAWIGRTLYQRHIRKTSRNMYRV